MKNIVVSVVVCGLFVAAGCGRKGREATANKLAEKMIATSIEKDGGGKADVDIGEGGVKITTPNGEFNMVAGVGVKMPEDLPADLFVCKDAAVQMAMKTDEGQMIALKSGAAVADIVKDCRQKMTDEGWEEVTSMDMQGQSMLVYQKGDRNVHYMIARPEGDQATVTMTISR